MKTFCLPSCLRSPPGLRQGASGKFTPLSRWFPTRQGKHSPPLGGGQSLRKAQRTVTSQQLTGRGCQCQPSQVACSGTFQKAPPSNCLTQVPPGAWTRGGGGCQALPEEQGAQWVQRAGNTGNRCARGPDRRVMTDALCRPQMSAEKRKAAQRQHLFRLGGHTGGWGQPCAGAPPPPRVPLGKQLHAPSPAALPRPMDGRSAVRGKGSLEANSLAGKAEPSRGRPTLDGSQLLPAAEGGPG